MRDLTSPNLPVTEGESDHEPFTEPTGYEGTGWLLAGAEGLSQSTLAKFRAASLAIDMSTERRAHDPQGVNAKNSFPINHIEE